MRASLFYRIAAVLLLLFAAGHTLGFRQSDPAWGAAMASAKRTLALFGHVVEDFIEVLRPLPGVTDEAEPEAARSNHFARGGKLQVPADMLTPREAPAM